MILLSKSQKQIHFRLELYKFKVIQFEKAEYNALYLLFYSNFLIIIFKKEITELKKSDLFINSFSNYIKYSAQSV